MQFLRLKRHRPLAARWLTRCASDDVGNKQIPPYRRGLTAALLVMTMLLAMLAQDAHAQTAAEIDVEQIVERIEQGQCQSAWSVLWAAANQGSGAAFALLAQAFVSEALLPPQAAKDDQHSQSESITFFALNALSRPSKLQAQLVDYPAFDIIVNDLLPQYLLKQSDQRLSAACTASSGDWQQCLAVAQQRGYIPSVVEFDRRIQSKLAQGQQARCG